MSIGQWGGMAVAVSVAVWGGSMSVGGQWGGMSVRQWGGSMSIGQWGGMTVTVGRRGAQVSGGHGGEEKWEGQLCGNTKIKRD